MNIDELRTVQTKERQKDSLQHLRDEFYEDVADYIQGLKDEREAAAAEAEDPFSSPEVSRLSDEIETAEDVVEAIYERRVGKVVKLASFAAADMPVDEEGLTTQERDLFDDLVARIGDNKTRVLDILAGEGDAGATAEPAATNPQGGPDPDTAPSHSAADAGAPPADESVLADAMGGADGAADGPDDASQSASAEETHDSTRREVPPDDPPEFADEAATGGDADPTPPESTAQSESTPPSTTPESSAAAEAAAGEGAVEEADAVGAEATDREDRTTVRITRDVGQILGVDDREYDLADEDVVALPAANADALLQRDAAERLE